MSTVTKKLVYSTRFSIIFLKQLDNYNSKKGVWGAFGLEFLLEKAIGLGLPLNPTCNR